MILEAQFGQHLPLNRQSESSGRERVELSVSTLTDRIGTAAAVLSPLHALIEAHVLAAERLHGDDTTVPLLARGKTVTARLWTSVRDDQPFARPAPPAAVFHFSRDRTAEHPAARLDELLPWNWHRTQAPATAAARPSTALITGWIRFSHA